MRRLPTLLPAVVAVFTLAACGSSGTKTVVVTETTGSATATSPAPPAPAGAVTTQTTTATGVTTATGPTNPPALLEPPPPSRTVHLTTFRSPSGNIGCLILGGTARCDISQRSWKPPARPASCPTVVDFGQGLEIGRSGTGRFVCAGDTALDPRGTPLPYGKVSVEGALMCTSATAGMACQRGSGGHGFFISRQGYRVF